MPGGLRLRCPAGLAGWPGWLAWLAGLAGLAGWPGWLAWLAGLAWLDERMRKFSHARRSEEVGGFLCQKVNLNSEKNKIRIDAMVGLYTLQIVKAIILPWY